eukprot:m.156422 g.156422  ORF g.156422 m.156422 type:complete len:213 (+) comp16440_c0_seq10:779-1417(+)
MSKATRFTAFPDAGFFLDATNTKNVSVYRQDFINADPLWNTTAAGTVNQACLQANSDATWKCLMAPYLSAYIVSDTFIMNSDVDHWQMNNILQIDCVPSACSPSSIIQVNTYRELFYTQLQTAKARANMHFYIDSCIVHEQNLRYCDGGNLHGWNCVGWTEHLVMSTTPQQAFSDYYFRNASTAWIDTSAYPTNPSCVFSPNPPTSSYTVTT